MILQIERAIDDLLRGYPLIINDNGRSYLIFAAETAEEKLCTEIFELVKSAPKTILTDKRVQFLMQQKVNKGFYTCNYDFTKLEELIAGNPQETPELNLAEGDIYQAAIKIAKLAELLPAVIIVEVTKAEATHLFEHYLIMSIAAVDIGQYDENINTKLEEFITAPLTLKNAKHVKIIGYRAKNSGKSHYVLIIGKPGDSPLLRIHSSCFTGDLLGSLKCDCGEQLQAAITHMAENGSGVIIYLMQEGRGIGLSSKMRTYKLQDGGLDTVEANEFLGYKNDERSFLVAQKIMQKLNIKKIRLISNNPRKAQQMQEYGIEVEEIVSLQTEINLHNASYLKTKMAKSGHNINIKEDD